ncbi:MAG: protocatechuate 3,4-dioxygenase subunit alpha [Rhodomicrobiaceae bacterium]
MADTSYPATPSQTVGPFFGYALPYPGGDTLTAEATLGERIVIEGRLFDGGGAPVNDGLIEIWQANSQGRYRHPEDMQEKQLDPNFNGFGRTETDEDGWFRFHTIKPGQVPGPNGTAQAPHINISVMGRGILKRLATRLYFSDEAANASDPILALVPQERRGTLIAERTGEGTVYRFDIILQGENETVFFDI